MRQKQVNGKQGGENHSMNRSTLRATPRIALIERQRRSDNNRMTRQHKNFERLPCTREDTHMLSRLTRSAAVTLASFAVLGIAAAACPDDGATPMNIGSHNTQTTFPLWVQDSEGLALEICPGTDQLNCISVPPFTAADFPGDPDAAAKAALSQQIGFGDEGFWASADAIIDIPAGGALTTPGRAILVSAVEAAFLPDFADGNQFPFTRLRIRIDIPQAGTYVVTHPWGQISYDVTTPGLRAINDSFDIQFVADQVGYQGRIGPILTWDSFPDDPLLDQYGPPFQFDPPFGQGAPDGVADYIGTLNFVNPDTGGPEHAVKGSPCGTNYFRIDGPDIGGPGIDSIQTDLFTVTGKLFNGASLPTPLTVNQASYSRTSGGRVSVFAKAPTQAEVSFSGAPNLPAGEQPMAGDGSGRFFASVTLTPDASTVPAQVSVTANNQAVDPDNLPFTSDVPLVDLVTITRADYDYASGELTIEAHSSDLFAPPALSALGQTLSAGVLTTNLTIAPPTVTVTSSAGGSATIPVTVIHTP